MAKRVHKCEIAIVVLSTLNSWLLVMHMEFFIIEEGIFADRAYPILFPGDLLSTRWEVFGLRCISLLPVVFESRVVW